MGLLEEAIDRYAGLGWSLMLLNRGEKKSDETDWPNGPDDPETLKSWLPATGANLAVRLGQRSGQLADVDLDDAGARALGSMLLPPTPCRFRRDGIEEDTHYLYLAPDGPPPGGKGTTRLQGERASGSGTTPHTYAELRWNGGYTVLPPSLHPEGGEYRWFASDRWGSPPAVAWATLADATREVAAGALLLEVYPDWQRLRSRHYATLALAAALLRAGWALPRVERFVYAVAQAAGDEEAEARVTNARTTAEAFARGEKALPGWGALVSYAGDERVKRFQRFLGVDGYANPTGAWAGVPGAGVVSAQGGGGNAAPKRPPAAPTTPVGGAKAKKQGPGQSKPPLRVVAPGSGLGRPQVETGHNDLLRLCEETWAAVDLMHRAHPDGPQIFRYGSIPVRIARWGRNGATTPGTSAALLQPLVGGEALRNCLATTLVEFGRTEHQQGGPDLWVADYPNAAQAGALFDYLDRSGVPEIEMVSGVPLLAPNGTVVAQAGYHAVARVYLEPEVTIPVVPDVPDAALIARCRDLWLDEVLVDFPFKEQADRANAFAMALTPYARAAIDGSVPLFGISATVQGTGKSRLAAVVMETAFGNDYARMMAVTEGDESRKQITATLKDLPRGVLLDNVGTIIDSSALAKVLTDSFWSDRILGVSTLASFPVKCVWIATGNHLQYAPDIVRRVVPSHLDANMERPWDRPASAFKHPELMTWVHDHRPDLVWASLVLVRAGLQRIAAGGYRGRSLGSFEAWARILGATLEVAGVPGFLENLSTMYDEADIETAQWRDYVTDWFARHQYSVTSSSDLWRLWNLGDYFPIEGRSDRAQQTRLGFMLRRMYDRPLAGKKIKEHPTRLNGYKQYHLVDA